VRPESSCNNIIIVQHGTSVFFYSYRLPVAAARAAADASSTAASAARAIDWARGSAAAAHPLWLRLRQPALNLTIRGCYRRKSNSTKDIHSQSRHVTVTAIIDLLFGYLLLNR
jgi:hypothetical protein